MSPIHTLQAVLRHAESERDAAHAALRRAEADAERARAQLEQLLAYRQQYEQRWSGQFAQGSSIDIVQCYQGFMTRLTQAVDQQQQAVARCQPPVQRTLAEYRSRELRVAAIGKLIERRLQDVALAGSRRDRKQSDESSALSARLRPDVMHAA